MKLIKRENLCCPNCQTTQLDVSALTCRGCEIEIRVNIQDNEFSKLGGDDLHFLRVFIHCEGKIKDVEKAMGLSYPSVKAKLGKLKERLGIENTQEESVEQAMEANEILAQMQNRQMTYESGLNLLKKLKKEDQR